MISRPQLVTFLRSIGLEASANDQASLCLIEKVVEAMGEVTPEMATSGGRLIGSRPMAARVYAKMFAERFG